MRLRCGIMRFMPFFTPLIIAIALLISSAKADEVKRGSVEWLEKGCAAFLYCSTNRDIATASQKIQALEISAYFRGFLAGVEGIAYAHEELPEKFYFPPDEWGDSDAEYRSILDFLSKNRTRIPANCHSWKILFAWYCENHPNTNAKHRDRGAAMLDVAREDAAKQGSQFVAPKAVPVKRDLLRK